MAAQRTSFSPGVTLSRQILCLAEGIITLTDLNYRFKKNRSLGRYSSSASIPAHVLEEIKRTISLTGFSESAPELKRHLFNHASLCISYLSINVTNINHTGTRGKAVVEIPVRAGSH